MSVRGSVRVTAAALTITVGGLAAAPALAAGEVAHGQASAATIAIAGMGQSATGTYSASNDGSRQTTSGSNKPPLTIPTGETIYQGTLNQDATTSIAGKVVSSAACAGISGRGASLVALGSDASCLRPNGQPSVSLNAGQLKLDTVTGALKDNQLSDQLPPEVKKQLTDLLGELTDDNPAADALTTALNGLVTKFSSALGNPSISLGAGVIQGQCTATQGSTTGDAQLADAGVNVDFGARAKTLGLAPIAIALPSDPAPNTDLVVGVGDLTKQLTAAVTQQLVDSAKDGGPLKELLIPGADALKSGLDPLVKQVVDAIVPQLGPLDQLLKGTLNKQTTTGDSQIHVTALDLQVVPAASQFTGGSSLASIQLGDVDCLGGTAAATPRARPASNVPTDIDSGLPGDSGGLPGGVLATFGALLLAAAGGIGVRRVRLHHGKG